MDIVLILLIVLCFAVLLMFYIVQKFKKTDKLSIIYKKLLKNNPKTIAWTFGWIDHRKSYKNVYANNGDKIQEYVFDVKYENYPISFEGKPLIVNNTHGFVKSNDDGFSISGINSDMSFSCPPGYSGPECQQSPVCAADEAGTYKLLSRDQFKTLNLYNYGGSNIHTHEDEYPYHQRLRVLCLNPNGEFNIEACADNKLVDRDTVQCKIYDLCNDRLDGYKHSFQVTENDTPLTKTQYYVCEMNKSVLCECKDDTVFSNANMGCIAQNQCYGLGEKRLVIDNDSYLQCSSDAGQIKRCKYGVGLHYETPYCLVPKCVPRTYTYDDGLLQFITGMIWCDDDDNAQQLLCDESATKKEYRYTWGSQPDVVVRIPNWPRSVFDETRRVCKEPNVDDIMIPQKYVKVRWTDNMSKAYDFDVRTEKFVCAPHKDLLQLDYVHNKLIPDIDVTGKFIDYSVPCQTIDSPVSFFDNSAFAPFAKLLSGNASLIEIYRPDNGRQFPLIYAVPIDDSVDTSEVDAVIFPPPPNPPKPPPTEEPFPETLSKDSRNEKKDHDDDRQEPRQRSVMALWPQYRDGYYYTFDYDPKTNRIVYFSSTELVVGFDRYSANKTKEWAQVPECLKFNAFVDKVPTTLRKLLYLFMIDGTVVVPRKRIISSVVI